ncbi:hypothetical protein [Clostridium butyricum]|uniref:hypothetical protein n=1 Tax=Clostridium butyricum TaxID=1492 RepID=UPI002ABE803B|nr:hypothetical protein [Clostridium butyricum]
MSKFIGILSYKDWCIIKHGLKNSLHQKKSLLKMESLKLAPKLSIEARNQLEREVKEEERSLKRVTELVSEFKEKMY